MYANNENKDTFHIKSTKYNNKLNKVSTSMTVWGRVNRSLERTGRLGPIPLMDTPYLLPSARIVCRDQRSIQNIEIHYFTLSLSRNHMLYWENTAIIFYCEIDGYHSYDFEPNCSCYYFHSPVLLARLIYYSIESISASSRYELHAVAFGTRYLERSDWLENIDGRRGRIHPWRWLCFIFSRFDCFTLNTKKKRDMLRMKMSIFCDFHTNELSGVKTKILRDYERPLLEFDRYSLRLTRLMCLLERLGLHAYG